MPYARQTRMHIGEQLRAWRVWKGHSQGSLAEEARIAKSTITNLETGRTGGQLRDDRQARQSDGRYPRAIAARKAGVYEHEVREARPPHTIP